jgi:hypothetical protein
VGGFIRTMVMDPQRLDQAGQGPHLRGRRAACRAAARLKADAHRVTRELPSVSAGNEPIPLGNSYSVNPFSSIAPVAADKCDWLTMALECPDVGRRESRHSDEVRAVSSGIVLRTLKLPALARQLDRNVPRGADDDRASVGAGAANDRFQDQKKLFCKHVRCLARWLRTIDSRDGRQQT